MVGESNEGRMSSETDIKIEVAENGTDEAALGTKGDNPEPMLSEEQISAAKKMFESQASEEAGQKELVVERFQKAQAALDKFYSDRSFVMQNGDSAELNERIARLKEKIENRMSEQESQPLKQNWLSSLMKRKLKAEQGSSDGEIDDLKNKIAEMEALIPQVKAAEGFRQHDELELKAAVAAEKKEAERY